MEINVTKDIVKILTNDYPHENEYKIRKCYFTFDDFIDSFQVKRVIFTILSTGEMYENDIIDYECNIPIEVLKHEYETIKLGVYGYNIGENEELINRFSPSYDTFIVPTGSYQEGALSPEPITPTQYDIYSAKLQEGLNKIDDTIEEFSTEVEEKLEEVDEKLDEVDDKLEEVNQAITETNNLNIDVNKVGKEATVTLTRKDGTTKNVNIRDGYDIDYDWNGTELGIKREDEVHYEYVDLKGEKGDCNFATFSIVEGHLIMNKPEDLSQIDFKLDNRGHLVMEVGI